MRVLHVYNQAQVFHLSGHKVDHVIRTEGQDCIFAWLSEDLLDSFNARYGSFASFIANEHETRLFLNLDGELFPLVIRYLQTGELHVPPNETQSILSLAAMLGFPTIIAKINNTVNRELEPIKELLSVAVSKGINKDSALEVWDQFVADHTDYLVHMTSHGLFDPLLGLLSSLVSCTDTEHEL